jgi:hypothetical protein
MLSRNMLSRNIDTIFERLPRPIHDIVLKKANFRWVRPGIGISKRDSGFSPPVKSEGGREIRVWAFAEVEPRLVLLQKRHTFVGKGRLTGEDSLCLTPVNRDRLNAVAWEYAAKIPGRDTEVK